MVYSFALISSALVFTVYPAIDLFITLNGAMLQPAHYHTGIVPAFENHASHRCSHKKQSTQRAMRAKNIGLNTSDASFRYID